MTILPDLNAKRILVVEGDVQWAGHLGEVLRSAGYSVQNAYNYGDALAAEHSRFHLGIVDAAMRDRDGTPILDGIRRHMSFKQLPLLMISEDGRKSGPNTLNRQFSDEELVNRVRGLLNHQKTPAVEAQSRKFLTEDDIPTEPTRISLDARLQQQLAELRTLSNLGRSISSVLELSEVLNQIVEAATTLTRAEEGLLLLPDEDGKILYMRAMKGIDDSSARNFRIRTQDPLVGRVYVSGEPVLIGDRGLQRVKTEYFVKSLLYVPMTYKGQTIGVLGVNNRRIDRIFTAHDQELLLDLAAHAAIAIENARLYEERLLQNRQLTMLVSAAKAVNSTLALSDVLSILCQQMIQTLEVSVCMISREDETTHKLRPLAGARRIARRADQCQPTMLADRPILKEAVEKNMFYAVKRSRQEPDWQEELPYMDRDGAEQMIVLPIRPSNQPAIGVLELLYQGSAPEMTNQIRATVRGIALEIMSLIAETRAAMPLYTIFSNAQKILDATYANWTTLSIIQDAERLATVMEYGAAVFPEDSTARRLAYPETSEEFGDQTPLNFHSREADLPVQILAAMESYGAEAVLSLPLTIKGSPFGAVTIYNTQEARHFRSTEISLAWALVTQAATAIENAKLYNDLEQSLADLRNAQAQLVQAARLSTMGELAAVVAHQINNPLTTIIADAELILQEMDEADRNHEGLTAIHRAGQRAHNVVKRLLTTARRNGPDEGLQRIEVHETIHHTLELVTTHIERSKVRFDIALEETIPAYVMAAPGHLEDLWLNLFLNARDALANTPDAAILIYSRFIGDTLDVSICDNGPGIPPEYVDNIFLPFFTTKPAGQGTGLGLYICKQIVDQCQGTITVETGPRSGTCFRIALPTRP